jgi:hypothetical protein
MISNNYFTDDEDLQIVFNHLIDWKSIVEGAEGDDFYDHKYFLKTKNPRYEMAPSNFEEALELYKSCLDSLGEFFGKDVSQVAQAMDRNISLWNKCAK